MSVTIRVLDTPEFSPSGYIIEPAEVGPVTDMTNLTLEQAEGWIKKACGKATQLGVKVSVYVVDASGNPVAFARMDGAGILTPDIARAKAYTAIAFKSHSKDIAERMKDRPAAALGLTQASGSRVVFLPGGVLHKRGEDILGAVGVSGASSDQDHECGIEAIEV
jgi:uncharacterized protein GlcG (DUF336 family)